MHSCMIFLFFILWPDLGPMWIKTTQVCIQQSTEALRAWYLCWIWPSMDYKLPSGGSYCWNTEYWGESYVFVTESFVCLGGLFSSENIIFHMKFMKRSSTSSFVICIFSVKKWGCELLMWLNTQSIELPFCHSLHFYNWTAAGCRKKSN